MEKFAYLFIYLQETVENRGEFHMRGIIVVVSRGQLFNPLSAECQYILNL